MSGRTNAGTDGITDQTGAVIFAHGDTVPPAGTNGYAQGCLFVDTDSAVVLSNTGSLTSCDFTTLAAASTSVFATDDGIDCNPGSDIDCDLITVGVTGTPKLYWDESEDSFVVSHRLAVFDGTGIESASDAAVFVKRTVGGATSLNAHCFGDYSTVTRSAGIGYNSFNCNITVAGTADYNHFAGFQQAGSYGTSGTIGKVYGMVYATTIEAGCTVTNAYGVYVNASAGGGTVTNDYGIYIVTGIKGATLNYAIYSAGAAPSHFVGNIGLGNGTTPQTDKRLYVGGSSTTGSVNNTGISVEHTYTGTYLTGLNLQCASAGSSAITGIFTIHVRPNHGSSSTLASFYGLYSAPTSSGGLITNLYHAYIADTVGGTLTNQYGVYVAALAKGGTLNYAIYTAGATPSLFTGAVTVGGIVMTDAKDIVIGTTTGTKIGTAANQKLGFFNATPRVQCAKASFNNWAAFGDVVNALVALGLFDAA